ncbi:MAG TPA: hypothetical protein VGK73_14475 [Polyangiaceae bacterium]
MENDSEISTNPRVNGARPEEPRFTCLIVDHGRKNQRELFEHLRGLELRVIAAENATDALRLLRNTPVDVVIAEEYLLGTSGSVLLEAVLNLWPNVVRILIGQELASDVLTRAVNRARVHRVLHKTMALHSFRAEVESALNESMFVRAATLPAPADPLPSGVRVDFPRQEAHDGNAAAGNVA